MKHYEVMIIVDPTSDEVVDEVRQKTEGIVTGREGAIDFFDKLGKKRLAYPIAKRSYGVYLLFNIKANSKIIQALDYYLKLNPAVLRYLILAFTDKDLRLRRLTERVQHEEAERMRQGGRPVAGPVEDDTDSEAAIAVIMTQAKRKPEARSARQAEPAEEEQSVSVSEPDNVKIENNETEVE